MASESELGITFDASAWLSNYGHFSWGPNILVLHSLECDAIRGIARSLSERGGWLDTENLAPQRMTAPSDLVRTMPDGDQGGHIGGPGNSHCAGVEVAGVGELGIRQTVEVAREVGAPVAEADHTDADLVSQHCLLEFPDVAVVGDAGRGVAKVNDELRVAHDLAVVD